MTRYYCKLISVELFLLVISILLSDVDFEPFYELFILFHILFFPSFLIAFYNRGLSKYYYFNNLWQYEKYFKNKKIKHIHDYICFNFNKLEESTARHLALRVEKLTPPKKGRWHDNIKNIYNSLNLTPHGSYEEVILKEVAWYNDDYRYNEQDSIFKNMVPDFKVPLKKILDELYTDTKINPSTTFTISQEQYEYYAILLHSFPYDIIRSIYYYRYYTSHFFANALFGQVAWWITLLFPTLVGALFVVIMIIGFLYIMRK